MGDPLMQTLTQRKLRMRRSMLFVPGANAAMVSNAFIYQADAVMFDLEDSVILREKDAARRLVYHALQHPLYRETETIVRVNALDSVYGLADLEAVVRGGADIVRLPKTDTAQDVTDMETEIARIEAQCGRPVGSTGMLAAIESARGITQAVSIASASPRLIGIALAQKITSAICAPNAPLKEQNCCSPGVPFYKLRALSAFRLSIRSIRKPTTTRVFSTKRPISNS